MALLAQLEKIEIQLLSLQILHQLIIGFTVPIKKLKTKSENVLYFTD